MKRPQRLDGSRRVAVAPRTTVPRTETAGYQQKRKQIAGSQKPETGRSVIAVALTWDGARWPVRTLPPKARAFLAGKFRGASSPSAKTLATLFADDQVQEIRICWVPLLKGGGDVLAEPFSTPGGMRIGFRSVKTVRFGELLGVVYRRGLPIEGAP